MGQLPGVPLPEKFDFQLGATLPGESIIAAILNYAAKTRETMSQEHRDRQDALALRIQEDSYFVWRQMWQRFGVLKPEDPKS